MTDRTHEDLNHGPLSPLDVCNGADAGDSIADAADPESDAAIGLLASHSGCRDSDRRGLRRSAHLADPLCGAGALVPLPPAPASHYFLSQDRARSYRGVSLMGIFSRTRDIIAANMTDLLDKSEDPAKLIRMIIFEMDETLVEVRASAARVIADQKEMQRHVAKLQALQDSWNEKAELALSKDREDLAKAALIERKKASDMVDRLKGEIATLDDTLKGYEGDITKLQQKLREARTRQNAIANRLESAENKFRMRELIGGERTADAMSRFDDLERRVDIAEGRADAMAMGGGERTLEDEFDDLRSSDAIDEELAAMKARLNKKG
jgi:phage shock protein A